LIVACAQREGFRINPELAADDLFQYTFPAPDGAQAALDRCRQRWSQMVELAYQVSQGPSAEEFPMVREVIDCLRAAGQSPTSGIRVDQLRAFMARLPPESPGRACARLLLAD